MRAPGSVFAWRRRGFAAAVVTLALIAVEAARPCCRRQRWPNRRRPRTHPCWARSTRWRRPGSSRCRSRSPASRARTHVCSPRPGQPGAGVIRGAAVDEDSQQQLVATDRYPARTASRRFAGARGDAGRRVVQPRRKRTGDSAAGGRRAGVAVLAGGAARPPRSTATPPSTPRCCRTWTCGCGLCATGSPGRSW